MQSPTDKRVATLSSGSQERGQMDQSPYPRSNWLPLAASALDRGAWQYSALSLKLAPVPLRKLIRRQSDKPAIGQRRPLTPQMRS